MMQQNISVWNLMEKLWLQYERLWLQFIQEESSRIIGVKGAFYIKSFITCFSVINKLEIGGYKG